MESFPFFFIENWDAFLFKTEFCFIFLVLYKKQIQDSFVVFYDVKLYKTAYYLFFHYFLTNQNKLLYLEVIL